MKKTILLLVCYFVFFSSFAQKGTDTTKGLDDISKDKKRDMNKHISF